MKAKRSLLVVIACAMTLLAFKPGSRFTEQDEYVRFEIKNAGIMVEAAFDQFETDIQYNEANPAKSKFNATIAVSSINTGIDMRNEHLQEEEYFYASEYPNITFESTSVSKNTIGELVVNGKLTIRGVTKTIALKTKPEVEGDKTYFKTEFSLNRLDYKVGEASWIMGEQVNCIIRVAAD